MNLVFATNNAHKLHEVSALLHNKIVSLNDINCTDEIPETADTLEGNALLKARHIYEKFGYNCFADDTGLEVETLGNAPGVDTAHYAGEQRSAEDNMNKLLSELQGKENRKARFRTVIALIIGGKEYLFEGEVCGVIEKEKRGNAGFGYDPIFTPEGFDKTFAELPLEVKNQISHRGRAVAKLVDFLREKKQ